MEVQFYALLSSALDVGADRFTTHQFTSGNKPLDRWLGEPRTETNLFPVLGVEPRLIDSPARGSSLYRLITVTTRKTF
jgi:hypothetical protein